MHGHSLDGLSQAVLDSMAQAVFVKNAQGVVVYANPAYARLLGRPLASLVGVHDRELFPEEAVARFVEGDRQVLETGAQMVRESVLRTFAGLDLPVITTKARILDAAGRPHVLGTITDISARAAQEAELSAALEAARAAHRGRAAFLANISHGIRTPMNGVLGMLAVLQATPLTARQVAITEVIRQSGEILMRVLGDLITYASLEAGRVGLAQAPFVPETLLGRIADGQAVRARARGLGFEVETGPPGPAVLGDADRIEEVIGRLLDNALAFTSRGRIGLSLAREAAGPGRVRLRLAVSDTGSGLPQGSGEAALASLGRFAADQADSRAGVGLGLAICGHLMRAMGGEIALASRPGGGTVASLNLVLPLAPA